MTLQNRLKIISAARLVRDRRERLAAVAMQGLLSTDYNINFSLVVKDALRYADALIFEVDKEYILAVNKEVKEIDIAEGNLQ